MQYNSTHLVFDLFTELQKSNQKEKKWQGDVKKIPSGIPRQPSVGLLKMLWDSYKNTEIPNGNQRRETETLEVPKSDDVRNKK